MLWRKFKLDWHYAIGELAIVTVGVLIALWIQQWNDERQELLEEKAALERLLDDLTRDESILDFLVTGSNRKLESLRRVQAVLSTDEKPADPMRFLRDIVQGAGLGWNQPGPVTNTIDELLSSGNLRLIKDRALRDEIADYYPIFAGLVRRADARETAFPGISYQLVPRKQDAVTEDNPNVLLVADESLSGEQLDVVLDDIFRSTLRNHVTAEINLAMFIGVQAAAIQVDHSNLRTSIQNYRASLD